MAIAPSRTSCCNSRWIRHSETASPGVPGETATKCGRCVVGRWFPLRAGVQPTVGRPGLFIACGRSAGFWVAVPQISGRDKKRKHSVVAGCVPVLLRQPIHLAGATPTWSPHHRRDVSRVWGVPLSSQGPPHSHHLAAATMDGIMPVEVVSALTPFHPRYLPLIAACDQRMPYPDSHDHSAVRPSQTAGA